MSTRKIVVAGLVVTIGVAVALGSIHDSGSAPLAPRASAGAPVRVLGSATNVRPTGVLRDPGSSEAHLIAARNEFESFQVAVEGGPAGRHGVAITAVGPLKGPDGAVIPTGNVTVYREQSYRVEQPSDAEGGEGDWNDALIPTTDYFYGEHRNAFPADIGAERRLVAFVDVLIPREASPGHYTGSVAVRDRGGAIATVPISLSVIDLVLPSSPTLKTIFPLDSYAACTAYTGTGTCDDDQDKAWLLERLFARAGLENRITIANPFPQGFSDGGGQTAPVEPADQRRLRDQILPLFDGSDTSLRLPGAALGSALLYASCVTEVDPSTGRTCLEDWKRLADRYGLTDKVVLYACDEPGQLSGGDSWADCIRTASQAEATWPGIRRLITSSIDQTVSNHALGAVDTLVPNVTAMANRPGVSPYAGDQRGSYDGFLDPGSDRSGAPDNQLWMYTSCDSYGCGEDDSPTSKGFPGYAIDEPGSQARAMGWLSYIYNTAGELYYDVGFKLSTAWTNSYFSGGNGDGTLFYPGLVNGGAGAPAIGGSHDIPIESLRLKRIRDGLEDYEYLNALAARGEAGAAAKVATGLFGNPDRAAFSTTVSQAAFDRARCELATLLDRQHSPRCG